MLSIVKDCGTHMYAHGKQITWFVKTKSNRHLAYNS